MAKKFFNASEARARFLELLDSIQHNHDRVIVMKSGKPQAILLSYSDWEGIVCTMQLLSNPAAMEKIHSGVDDLKSGRVRVVDQK